MTVLREALEAVTWPLYCLQEDHVSWLGQVDDTVGTGVRTMWLSFLSGTLSKGPLINNLNKCGVISPRFDVQLKDLERWQSKLLPSRQFGFIVLTTSVGIMDHEEAR